MQKILNFKCNNKNTIKIIILNEQNIFLKLFFGKKILSKIFWAKCHCQLKNRDKNVIDKRIYQN